MSQAAFFLILFSAILHVLWNLLAKKGHFSVPFYAILATVPMLCCSQIFFWTPVDIAKLPLQCWLLLGGAVFFDATFYCLGVVYAYRKLEMSLAYPVMRALPLLFTVILTAIFQVGSRISLPGAIGAVIIVAGCIIMPLKKLSDLRWSTYFNSGTVFLLVVAVGTTGYSFCDDNCQKLMAELFPEVKNTFISLTYYTLLRKKSREVAVDILKHDLRTPAIAGIFAAAAYICVLLSMTCVSNISYVLAFRQIGLVIGAASGIIFLKETATKAKAVGVVLIVSGLMLMTFC